MEKVTCIRFIQEQYKLNYPGHLVEYWGLFLVNQCSRPGKRMLNHLATRANKYKYLPRLICKLFETSACLL